MDLLGSETYVDDSEGATKEKSTELLVNGDSGPEPKMLGTLALLRRRTLEWRRLSCKARRRCRVISGSAGPGKSRGRSKMKGLGPNGWDILLGV